MVGEAIRSNVRNKDGRCNAIWIISKHMIRNDAESLEVQQSLSEGQNDQKKIEGTKKIQNYR